MHDEDEDNDGRVPDESLVRSDHTARNVGMAQRVNDNHTGCPPGSTDGAVSCTTRTRTTTAGSPTRAWSRVRYPRSKQEEQGHRSAWPWLPGSILEQCGPDEWDVCVEVRELPVLRGGR